MDINPILLMETMHKINPNLFMETVKKLNPKFFEDTVQKILKASSSLDVVKEPKDTPTSKATVVEMSDSCSTKKGKNDL